MRTDVNTLIQVQHEWNGWRAADVRFGDLQNVHWLQPAGAPHPLVHAYISCASVVHGDIPHACDRESTPHRLRVCVLKRHAIATTYAELARRADEEAAVQARPRSA